MVRDSLVQALVGTVALAAAYSIVFRDLGRLRARRAAYGPAILGCLISVALIWIAAFGQLVPLAYASIPVYFAVGVSVHVVYRRTGGPRSSRDIASCWAELRKIRDKRRLSGMDIWVGDHLITELETWQAPAVTNEIINLARSAWMTRARLPNTLPEDTSSNDDRIQILFGVPVPDPLGHESRSASDRQ